MNSSKVNEMVESLRLKLHERAKDSKHFTDPSVVEMSQKLDFVLLQAQRLKQNNKKCVNKRHMQPVKPQLSCTDHRTENRKQLTSFWAPAYTGSTH